MKKTLAVLFLLINFYTQLQAQITIDQTDLASAGDSVKRYSASGGDNYQNTGANIVWDYSTMVPQTLTKEMFYNISQAPLLAQLTYGLLANQNVKSQMFNDAQNPINLGGNALAGSFINIDSTMEYFKKNDTRFARTGYTIRLNSIDIPLPYDSNDVYYKLPMMFGNKDSNISVFEINSPFLKFLYYKSRQKRVNTVDGWGKLKVPSGQTFDVLRIKSEMYIKDTVHIDTGFVKFGLPFTRPKQVEYKWMAKGMDLPVMQVSGTEIGTNFVPTTVSIFVEFPLALNESYLKEMNFNLYFDKNSNVLNIDNLTKKIKQIAIYDVTGKLVTNKVFKEQSAKLPLYNINDGVYITLVQFDDNTITTQKFIK